MSLLLLRSLGPSYLSQCPALLLRPPGFRRNCFSSLPRRAPHPCWSASGRPPSRHLLLLSPTSSSARLLCCHHQNHPPGTSSHCFSTLGCCLTSPLVFSSSSCSGGGLLMERSNGDRPPPYKRWKSTGDNKGEREGRADARAAERSGGKASVTRPMKQHSSRDREAGAPRSKSWSSDQSGERRTSENHKKSKRRDESKGKGNNKKLNWEGGVVQGQGRDRKTHHRMEQPQPPPQPHAVDDNPNPWLSAGAPHRTYPPPPPPPPPAGAWRNPGPPHPPGRLRNTRPGTIRNAPPPPGMLRNPVPPPLMSLATGGWGNPPPGAGGWGNPPPGAGGWGNPPPGAGAWSNPPPGSGAWSNPPPGSRAWSNPPPLSGAWGAPPPGAGALGNPPTATLKNPASPGTFGNPEDFPPLPGSGPPPQRTQSQGSAAQPLQRQWEDYRDSSTHLQPTGGGGDGFDFSVMSYNILSQDLLHENSYLYRHCDPGVLPWDFRLPNLLREIRQYDADVLCLQEVQQDHYETQMQPALEALGYQCVYKKRTGKKPEGCAIMFKSSRLSLVSSHPLEYFRPGDALLDRDNVGLVLLLRPADAGGQPEPSDFFCVANTHLLYNPRRGDIKLAQLAILLAEIARLSRLPDGSSNPAVVCGDFNSVPWSPLYCLLTQGSLEFQGLPIGMVSGQEDGRGQRVLTAPIWSKSLGINQDCCYVNQPASQPPSLIPTEDEGAVPAPTVEQLTAKAPLAPYSRTRLRHSVGLKSSYSHLLMPDGRAEITTCHSRTAMTVDYILYTPDPTTLSSLPGGRGLQLLARLSLVGQSELKAVNGLPNQHHSSDHLPLLARFRLRR
ncbi:protein angel homolog 2 isoform X1 [Gadus morhua]|uniref:Endonuclease/exonuclease/phosphatase domain-containing protein n=1 Tax=Gadus morhua TaxID=8049 RepID=A0A8C5FLF9_GADMO|nr:protein angel homolog 2 isoform X1 [Gadus morhua]XP_030200819.1 protein angel homolog 2 isoform X1 [Gadus morhua]